jgi:microcystin-dependent protein
MSSPFIGEIRMFGGNFAPAGWALCNGQQLSIADNSALYSLIGTTYGGDGVNTFKLPDLRGRAPLHQGQGPSTSNYVIGQLGGVETVTLTGNQIPSHTHAPPACSSNNGTSDNPAGDYWSASATKLYTQTAADSTMNAGAVAATGGSQPHDNMVPFQAVNFIIALQGIFPSRN